MAKTLLDGVNEVLKKASIIVGDSGLLTTLTDSGRQHDIDVTVQAWNEVIEYFYSLQNKPLPKEMAEGTITLVTGDRDYALAADLIQLRFPLHDETNAQYIYEFREGYHALVDYQPTPLTETGLPTLAVIRPTDGELYFDKIPTSEYNGRIYTYRYDKDISLSLATDSFPFSDAVFRALVPAVNQIYARDEKKDFDNGIYEASVGKAMRLLTQGFHSDSWLPRKVGRNITDPYA